MKKHLLLALSLTLLLSGCSMSPKETGNAINECTSAKLGFQILYSGLTYNIRDVVCCTKYSSRDCDVSRLPQN